MNLNATIFAQMIVFAILVWFTMKYVWPPLAKSLDERAMKIAEGLAAADNAQKNLAQAQDKVNQTRKDVNAVTRDPVKAAATAVLNQG